MTINHTQQAWQPQAYQYLNHYWGYDYFRPFQLETVVSVLNKRDSLTLLPTGGGKSVCYQLPILFSPQKTALIISPLISLMHDQVAQARQRGLKAYALHSGLSDDERRAIYAAFRQGEVQLLYTSPERLAHTAFVEALQQQEQLAYIAIDEAHCISQWGHQFRPDYRLLGDVKQLFPQCSVHAFTATAPPTVQRDILQSLSLHTPDVFQASMFRANLKLTVQHRSTKKDTIQQLLHFVEQRKQQAGIIYCTSRNAVEEWVSILRDAGIKAQGYHAGMSARMRETNMTAFMQGKLTVMVATVAFGMGVDRADIRFVIHTSSPPTLEAYLQEAGRAGRDGMPSECLLLWRDSDFSSWRRRLKDDQPEGASPLLLEQQLQKVSEIKLFCESVQCRHYQLTAYFGQPLLVDYCSGCDYCDTSPQLHAEAGTLTLKILSAIWRLASHATLDAVRGVLKGDTALVPPELHHEAQQWSVFGCLSDTPYRVVALWLEQLHAQGLLVLPSQTQYASPTLQRSLELTSQGIRLLKQSKHQIPTHIKLMDVKKTVLVATGANKLRI
jgi:ATP-dependent DNA helicase RecQ